MENETFVYHQNNFIDSHKIINDLLELKKTKDYTTNHNSWTYNDLVPDGVGVIKRWQVVNPQILDYLCHRLAIVFENLRTSTYSFKFEVTEWNHGAFLPWHNDIDHLCAATCYLESTVEYGGEFLCKPFEDASLGMFLEPKINRVVLIRGVEHCVTQIFNGKRTTLQMWGEKK